MSLIELLGLVFTIIAILNFAVGFFDLKTSLALDDFESRRTSAKTKKWIVKKHKRLIL